MQSAFSPFWHYSTVSITTFLPCLWNLSSTECLFLWPGLVLETLFLICHIICRLPNCFFLFKKKLHWPIFENYLIYCETHSWCIVLWFLTNRVVWTPPQSRCTTILSLQKTSCVVIPFVVVVITSLTFKPWNHWSLLYPYSFAFSRIFCKLKL